MSKSKELASRSSRQRPPLKPRAQSKGSGKEEAPGALVPILDDLQEPWDYDLAQPLRYTLEPWLEGPWVFLYPEVTAFQMVTQGQALYLWEQGHWSRPRRSCRAEVACLEGHHNTAGSHGFC